MNIHRLVILSYHVDVEWIVCRSLKSKIVQFAFPAATKSLCTARQNGIHLNNGNDKRGTTTYSYYLVHSTTSTADREQLNRSFRSNGHHRVIYSSIAHSGDEVCFAVAYSGVVEKLWSGLKVNL